MGKKDGQKDRGREGRIQGEEKAACYSPVSYQRVAAALQVLRTQM